MYLLVEQLYVNLFKTGKGVVHLHRDPFTKTHGDCILLSTNMVQMYYIHSARHAPSMRIKYLG